MPRAPPDHRLGHADRRRGREEQSTHDAATLTLRASLRRIISGVPHVCKPPPRNVHLHAKKKPDALRA